MAGPAFQLTQDVLARVRRDPTAEIQANVVGCPARIRVGIADYGERIARHYASLIDGDLHAFATRLRQPARYRHFGLTCEFASPTHLELYQGEILCDGLRALVDEFGPVVVRNATMAPAQMKEGHRGRFQDLNFHIDRSANQSTQYSLYSRDAADPEQREPRTASTLFVSNLVALLQDARQRGARPEPVDVLPNNHTLFQNENVEALIGELVFEQPWTAPAGTAELACQHNPDCRHASWYRNKVVKGWPIGVRFLR